MACQDTHLAAVSQMLHQSGYGMREWSPRRDNLRVACQPKLTRSLASVSEGWRRDAPLTANVGQPSIDNSPPHAVTSRHGEHSPRTQEHTSWPTISEEPSPDQAAR